MTDRWVARGTTPFSYPYLLFVLIVQTKNRRSAVPIDELDLDSLRLSQNFGAMIGVKKALLSVPLRKPGKHEWFRVHPQWYFDAFALKMRGERKDELYVVAGNIVSLLPDEVSPMRLAATITRQGVFTLWPIRLPGTDGRQDEWARTAMEAALMAQAGWIRMVANLHLGSYEVFQPVADFPEPEWPDLGWDAILKLAFKNNIIDAVDHPALRQLRGEV